MLQEPVQDFGAGGYATELWRSETESAGRQSRLLHDIWNEIKSDAIIQTTGLEVEVDGATVVLRGSVASYLEKLAVLDAAGRVPGVRQVVDEITVQIPERYQWRDIRLARAARHVLEWHALVPSEAIALRVTDGWIDLWGEVSSDAQRIATERAVSTLRPVRGVRNRITRKAGPANPEVRARVEGAVHSRLGREGKHVKVALHGDALALEGRVRSLGGWLAAERAAASVPNAPLLENALEIEW